MIKEILLFGIYIRNSFFDHYKAGKLIFIFYIFSEILGSISVGVGLYLLKLILGAASTDSDIEIKIYSVVRIMALQIVLLIIVGIVSEYGQLGLKLIRNRMSNEYILQIVRRSRHIDLIKLEQPDSYDSLLRIRDIVGEKHIAIFTDTVTFLKSIVATTAIVSVIPSISPYSLLFLLASSLLPFLISILNNKDVFENFKETSRLSRIIEVNYNRHFDIRTIRDYKHYKNFTIISSQIKNFMNTKLELFIILSRRISRRNLQSYTLSNIFFSIAFFITILHFFKLKLPLGDLAVAVGGMQQIQSQSMTLLSSIASLTSNLPYLKHASDMIEDIYTQTNEVISDKETNIISVRKISFSYPMSDREVINSLNAIFEKGTLNIIIGRNGSGKSTLIKLVTGVIKPSSGKIYFQSSLNDTDLQCPDPSLVSVFHPDNVLYDIKILHNITLSDYVDINRVNYLIDKLGFHDLQLDYIYGREFGNTELSTGQIKKVLILRCFYKSSDVYILDEPFSYLDSTSKQKLIEYVNELKKKKIVIMVSHDEMNIDGKKIYMTP